MLIKEDGEPVKVLIQFSEKQGLDVTENIGAKELSKLLQEHWLRTKDQQYEVEGSLPDTDDVSLLKEMGFIDAIKAPSVSESEDYKGAVVLGGTVNTVRRRLAFLTEHTDHGHVYLLGSQRPLDPEIESKDVLTTPIEELPFRAEWHMPDELPLTEADMMKLVFEQSELPSAWRYILIDTPKQMTLDGSFRFSDTTDTALEFFKTNPDLGQYFVVSNQPYVQRQTLNVVSVAPREYRMKGIGYAAKQDLPLQIFKDEIARCLYEEILAL